MRLLRDVAYVRSGDKGDTVTIGVIARTPGDYRSIVDSVDEQAVQELFGDWLKGRVDIYRMDNIHAVVVVLNHGLGGGRREHCVWTRLVSRSVTQSCACP